MDHRDLIYFYSHAPRGARRHNSAIIQYTGDFYSHAPRGARLNIKHAYMCQIDFYSQAPRGARRTIYPRKSDKGNFYSHAPRGARPAQRQEAIRRLFISTHTPLAGRDEIAMLMT